MRDGQTEGRADGQEVELPEALRREAGLFNVPPAVPREEIWARIQAVRENRPSAHPAVRPSVLPVRPSVRVPVWLGIAALLALGIGIGRWSLSTGTGDSAPPASVAAVTHQPARRPNAAVSVATTEHLTRTEAFLTAVRVGDRGPAFEQQARDLLLNTRLLLDSRGLTDPRTRALLEDLELVLVQIAQVPRQDGSELDLLNDALAQRQVLPRLRKEL